ncbi:hypothetical protein [Parabacteroides faecis]|uniref:hypothetical protein n=1 Tax=Parabacteroides faecis TaxID=1217282 RepID=UPI00351F8298
MGKSANDYLSREQFGYDLYQMMYDTVNMILYQKDVLDMNFLKEIPQYLTKANKNENDEGFSYVKGKLGSLDVYINNFYIKIHGSLCRYYHDCNVKALTVSEARMALLRIGEALGLPLEQATVTRLDIAGNIKVNLPVRSYYPFLHRHKRYKKVIYGKDGVYFKTKNQEQAFYDKNKEKGRKNAGYLLRYELRLIHPSKIWGRMIKVVDLYNPAFWNQMLDLWYNCYLDIEKVSNVSSDISMITGKKDLYDIALKKLCDDEPTIFDQLEIAMVNGALNKNTAKSIKKMLQNIFCSPLPQYKNSLIKELDCKMQALTKLFKQ